MHANNFFLLHHIGNNELVSSRRLVAEVLPPHGPLVENSSFVLAAERTSRRDPLNGYKLYTGGWNISETHYWAVSSSSLELIM